MIYVTGDTHGLIDFEKLRLFARANPSLTKRDYVIVAGDFGGVWNEEESERVLSLYSALPFTTLFVDGNHENFDLLNAYPIETWMGGKIHRVRADVIHLMRGQVFELEQKTFFAFGGATSTDRATRVEGHSWWPQEAPTYDDLDEGVSNLKRYGNKVDYIITHSCDERALWYPLMRRNTVLPEVYPENRMLSYFEDVVEYRHWYFGHYHADGDLNDRKTVLYRSVLPVA